MLLRAALPTLLLLLAGCAAPPPPGPGGAGTMRGGAGAAVPRQVTLYRDTVTARMSDGTLCAAVREAGAGPWSAPLRGCPHPWPVRVARTATVPRLPLAPTTQAPWVTLGAPSGPLAYAPRP